VAEDLLRVSLDVTAVPSKPVGAGQYTISLAEALAARSDLDLVAFSRRSDTTRWLELARDARGARGARGLDLDPVAPSRRPLRLAWEQVLLPRLLHRESITVHHGPHYTMPEHSSVPVVVTIHDLSFFEESAWHERSKVLLFRRAIKVAARRASAVVCPSRATAEQLARWCQVDAEVFVAHHGVDTRRFRPDDPVPGSDADRLAGLDDRLLPGRPFLVFVGTIEPRKNLPQLVEAFSRIADLHPDVLLVLAGGAGWGADELDQAIGSSRIADRIVRTGYVPDDTVPALLRSSVGAVYPALYEGFGLPALEALACGTPLVTSVGTAMEEVAGDAALLVEPGDPPALADALDLLLTQGRDRSSLVEERRERGFRIVERHTWAASASRHVAAYRSAAGLAPLAGEELPVR
jgi:glycosyltransferase involved in cell wall biosynthesis